LVKLLPFHKTFIFFWINLKTIFLTKYFKKTLWLPYWPSYIIDLTCFLFVYIPTHPPIHMPIHLFIYLPTYPHVHLPTHHLHDVMSTNVWNTKYEGTVLNELTTILIIFDPLMLINDNLECQYYTFNQHPYISIAKGMKSSPSVHSTYDCIFSWTTIVIAWTIIVDACYTISIQVGSRMTMSIKRTSINPYFH